VFNDKYQVNAVYGELNTKNVNQNLIILVRAGAVPACPPRRHHLTNETTIP
jgi:hypothetical protein